MTKKTLIIIIFLFLLWSYLAILVHNTNVKVTKSKKISQCNDSVLVYADYNENTGIATYKNTEISICNIEK